MKNYRLAKKGFKWGEKDENQSHNMRSDTHTPVMDQFSNKNPCQRTQEKINNNKHIFKFFFVLFFFYLPHNLVKFSTIILRKTVFFLCCCCCGGLANFSSFFVVFLFYKESSRHIFNPSAKYLTLILLSLLFGHLLSTLFGRKQLLFIFLYFLVSKILINLFCFLRNISSRAVAAFSAEGFVVFRIYRCLSFTQK